MREPARDRDWMKLHGAFSSRLRRWLVQVHAEFPQFRVRVGEGRRSSARQAWLFASGRTRPGPVLTNTMASRHLYGLAADLVLVRKLTPFIAIWDGRVWRAVYERVPPEKYGLRDLRPFEFTHLEHEGADALIAKGKPAGIYRA